MIVIIILFWLDQILASHHHGRKKLEMVDKALSWIIKICLVLLFFTLPDLYEVVCAQDRASSESSHEFFFACSGGDLKKVQATLTEHPDWVNARTENGEVPLHLTGIFRHDKITRLLLELGADPDARSTFEQGLRMHPLSWNIYGGHTDNIQLLLEYGADVNLDFDSMVQPSTPVTALDVLLELQKTQDSDPRFLEIEKILRKYGAKTTKELESSRFTSQVDSESEF